MNWCTMLDYIYISFNWPVCYLFVLDNKRLCSRRGPYRGQEALILDRRVSGKHQFVNKYNRFIDLDQFNVVCFPNGFLKCKNIDLSLGSFSHCENPFWSNKMALV